MRCPVGHSFDLARQGYVALLDGRSGGLRADTAEMVAARTRVHEAGVLDSVVSAVADGARELVGSLSDHPDDAAPLIVDLGGGPGHYLRAAMTATTRPVRGLVADLSKYSARAVVRGTPPAAAVVADIWRPLPLGSASTALVLSVFAPRNAEQTARILRDDGHLMLVAPAPEHLAELIEPMQMLSVAPDKSERIDAALEQHFRLADRRLVRSQATISAAAVADLVAMGPSAFHHDRSEITEVAERVCARRGGELAVTCAVTVSTYRPRR